MSIFLQCLIIFTVLIFFLLSGMPVAFAIGIASSIILIFFTGFSYFGSLPSQVFDSINEFSLLAVPLFILMGAIVSVTPIGRDLYEGINRWFSKIPGALAASNVVACAIFSALCGSSPATAAAIGSMGIPEMTKRGYPTSLAAGSIMGGGALGHLIPPGILPIIYGIVTGTSVGQIYIAAIIPGIIVTLLMCTYIVIYSIILRRLTTNTKTNNEYFRSVKFSWYEKFSGSLKILPFMGVIVFILYVLFGGYATPSEAAGVATLVTFLFAGIIYRPYNLKTLKSILHVTTSQTTMIMLIVAMSGILTYVLARLYISQELANQLINLDLSRWVLMVVINIFFLLTGMFIPPVALVLIICPILHPIIIAYGFDPVWFGVILSINLEIAMITPPLGIVLYVVQGIIPDVPVTTIILGSLPFIFILLSSIVIFSIWPNLVLWLPGLMF